PSFNRGKHVRIQSFLAVVAMTSLGLASALDASAAAGDADPSFGGAGYVRHAAQRPVPGLFSAVLPLDDGSVIAAGSADIDVFVRHYLADGSLDERFGSFGTTIVPGFVGGGRAPASLRL